MGYWFIILLQLAAAAQNHNSEPMIFQWRTIANSNIHSCPPLEEIEAAKRDIKNDISDIVRTSHRVPNCGDGLWYRVAHLNMSDPSQQCPAAWREVTIDGIRVCARPTSTVGSCPSAVYPVNYQYRKVCGRVIGYQFGSPGAFYYSNQSPETTIDEPYLDGVSITHGTPRTHVWSYVAGASENGSCILGNCLCSNGNEALPSFVGDNYYCESAYTGDCFTLDVLTDDLLWDGQQCNNEGMCCTDANTPPWFSVRLPDTTSDDIEVRICHNQRTGDEDTPIHLLELYIQ